VEVVEGEDRKVWQWKRCSFFDFQLGGVYLVRWSRALVAGYWRKTTGRQIFRSIRKASISVSSMLGAEQKDWETLPLPDKSTG
jgi:hypothetical protein